MLESVKNPAVKVKVEALIGTKLGNTPAAIKAELAKVSQETLAQTLYRKYAGDNAQGSVYTEHNNVGSEEIAGDYEGISAGGAGAIESGGEIRGVEGARDAGKIAEGGSSTGFSYKNSPMNNPKAAKDVVENPNAVYGYSPNPKSERIGKFAEFDWTDKDVVSNAREARLQYHKDNELMYNLVKEMQHDGATVEEIARAANQQRNLNRLQIYIDTGNIGGYEKAVDSNMKNFHNNLGMTAEQAYDKYGSWDIVLESNECKCWHGCLLRTV